MLISYPKYRGGEDLANCAYGVIRGWLPKVPQLKMKGDSFLPKPTFNTIQPNEANGSHLVAH